MDDPWGSPWTLSSTDVHDDRKNKNRNDTDDANDTTDKNADTPKPPRPAVLADSGVSLSGNTPFSSLPEPSPWADDDDDFGGFHDGGGFDDDKDNAFGDWAAPAPTLGGFGGFGDSSASGWGDDAPFSTSAAPQHLTTPRKKTPSGFGLELSPIAWPRSAALSPAGSPGTSPSRLRTRSRSRSSTNGSALGDAWATSTSTATTTFDRSEVAMTETTEKTEKTKRTGSTYDIPVLRLDREPTPTAAEPTKTPDIPQIVADDVDDVPTQPAEPSHGSTVSTSSRRSSAGSDGSRHTHDDADADADVEEPQQDSPTTSIEDMHGDAPETTDATTPRPALVQRTSSSKVQGLVEMFDGLSTRPASTRALLASPSRAASGRHGSIGSEMGESEDDGGFVAVDAPVDGQEPPTLDEQVSGPPDDTSDATDEDDEEESDKEDAAVASVETPKAVQVEVSPTSSDENQAPESTTANDKTDKTEADTAAPEKTSTDNKPEPSPDILSAARLLAIYGKQAPYTVDLAKVHELFPDTPPTKKDGPPLDAFIPDYILDDSFTSISERKTWYRIARNGSARRHNMGGDDDYRPVTWRTSSVRDDTTKIVRRWMEEDSFTGKPTLGGGFGSSGGGGGNLFGWDSAAEPVSLDEVFKRKRPTPGGLLGHQKTLSTASSTWAHEGGSPGGLSSFSPGPSADGFSPAPVFGWGSHDAATSEPTRNSMQLDRAGPVAVPVKPVAAVSPQTSSQAKQPSRFSVILPPADLTLSRPVTDTGPVNSTAGDDDDDDWGEMVTSPSAEQTSFPPPPTQAVSVSVPVSDPAPAPTLDDREVAALADSIIQGLPDLSYMAV